MTDFLNSLAARSFGTETPIRPRLASLFEPAPGLNSAYSKTHAPPLEGPDAISEIEAWANGADKDVKSSDTLHAAKTGHAMVDTAPQSRSESTGNFSPKIDIPTRARMDDVAKSIAHEPDRKDSRLPVPLAAHDQHQIVSEDSSPRASEAIGRDWISTASIPSVPAMPRDEKANETASVLRHESSEERSSLAPSSKAIAELAAQMSDAAAAMGTIRGALRGQAASRSAQTRTAEPDSSVQVTIGRIEVRAVTENNRVSSPRAASPVMSLEEYMRRRSQRGGR
jgi:hypothetical protein